MKLNRCCIYQFGNLKEKEFEFDSGITLIQGKNESGKTTLHEALAALLFGAEKGRGRSPKDSIYRSNIPWSNPQLYGGSLDWEREGRRFHVERDLAKNPPRASLQEIGPEGIRDISPEELPWPASFSPYLYFNTLSFKQQGSAVESNLRDELRSHIINLKGSGSETIDIAAAMNDLREKKRALQKQIRPETPARLARVRQQLEAARQESFSPETESGQETRDQLAQNEAQAQRLSEKKHRLDQALSQRRALLKERGLEDQEQLKKDQKKAEVIANSMENYEDSYAPGEPDPWVIHLCSWMALPFMLLFFWIVVNSFQNHRYFPAVLAALGFFVSLFVSIRFSRKQDARTAQKQNKKALAQLLKRYLPEYEPTLVPEEARDLTDYLKKTLDTLDYLEDMDGSVQAMDEEIQQMEGENRSLGRALEEDLSLRMARERWELRLQALMDEADSLAKDMEVNRQAEEEIRALDLALDTLSTLSARSYSDFGAPLTESASAIFREITEGHYQGIRVNDKMEIFAEQNHQLIAPEALSGGTMEQLYFSFRMALIRLLWPREDMPLFFDDSFAFYDEERLRALLNWLHKNHRGQTLIFTCQTREEMLLNELGIPYGAIALD